MKKFPFLINNGRANVIWQSSYLDQDNEFVTDRMPYPYLQANPQDMDELRLKQGDLVEVYNDNNSTQAMVYPTPTANPTLHPGNRRAGKRGLTRCERTHYPELQVDLGEHP